MNTPPTRVAAAALQQALDALKTYDAGSDRGLLVPLDDAVVAAIQDTADARELESRFIEGLNLPISVPAREYLCGRLALIGSAAAVPSLASLLHDPLLARAAQNALQLIPDADAGKALIAALPGLNGLAKMGAVTVLGTRREAAAVPILADILAGSDEATAATDRDSVREHWKRAGRRDAAHFFAQGVIRTSTGCCRRLFAVR